MGVCLLPGRFSWQTRIKVRELPFWISLWEPSHERRQFPHDWLRKHMLALCVVFERSLPFALFQADIFYFQDFDKV